MKTIAMLQSRRPNLHVLIVGSDLVAYGSGRSDQRSWGEWARADLPLDPKRTHWMGPLQTAEYHAVLAWSDVHLYLTVPFVLSWSLIEAMAARCCIVGSATHLLRSCCRTGILHAWWIFLMFRSGAGNRGAAGQSGSAASPCCCSCSKSTGLLICWMV